MSRPHRVFVAGILAVALPLFASRSTSVSAQSPIDQAGGRQGGAAPDAPAAASTALILGNVVDGSSGEPIADAVVTLRSAGARGGRGMPAPTGNPATDAAMEAAFARLGVAGGRGSSDQRILTGGDGRFLFHSLPPGNYSITASLDGYVASPGAGAGQISLLAAMGRRDAASPLALTEGQILRDLKIRLWKLGAISGTVRDDLGDPAVGIQVQAMRRIIINGRAQYLPENDARTDDRGVFRIGRLMPADYIVVVPQTQTAFPAALLDRAVQGVLNSDLSGSMELIDVMSAGITPSQTMGAGVRVGPYLVSAAGGAMPVPAADGKLLVFQTAFYAGATAPTQATVISLKSGEERTGADFQLRLIPTVRVSGVLTENGTPVANVGVKLVVPADGVVSESEFDVATSVTTSDGAFTFFGVPPGQFVLRASRASRPQIPAGANALAAGMMMGTGNVSMTKALFAERDVAVGSEDVNNVALPLQEAFTVSGRVEFSSDTGKSPPPKFTLNISLTPADGRRPTPFGMLPRPNRPAEMTTFSLEGIMPGKYFLNVPALPGWFPDAATVGGRDVWDAPLEVRNGDVSGIVVTFTDVAAQISGTVQVTGEQKIMDATVVVFPADYKSWIENGMNPRRFRVLTPGAKGEFTISGLGSGDFFAIAIDRGEEGDLQNPAFLERLARGATRIRIGRDTQPPLTLTVTPVVR